MPRLTKSKQVQVRDSLVEFCDDIEATGGISPNPVGDGTSILACDDEWVDLAETYLKACRALGRKPKYEG